MREFNAFRALPAPVTKRDLLERDIHSKIIASYRDDRYFDGARKNGYGGLQDDGRWAPVAADIVAEYGNGPLLHLQCEKGFLIHALNKSHDCRAFGVESSLYARDQADPWIQPAMSCDIGGLPVIPEFDTVIAAGPVYTGNLAEAIWTIRHIQRMSKRAWITLASFDVPEHESIMRQWSLLGCTILSKPDWLQVLEHCGYCGDYWFVTPRTLGLVE